MSAGDAEEPFHPNRHRLRGVADGSRVASVANNRAGRDTAGTDGRAGESNLGKLLGVLLDVLTNIHDNDHGFDEARTARTAQQRGAFGASLLSSMIVGSYHRRQKASTRVPDTGV